MRIDGFSGINQIYKPQSVARTGKVGRTAYQPDSLEISSFGKDLQTVRQAVAGTPDIRDEKIAPIKASISAGTYNVDNSDFASRLIEKYQEKVVF